MSRGMLRTVPSLVVLPRKGVFTAGQRAVVAAVLGGAHVIRAHDVAETVQAVRVAHSIARARSEDA